MKKFFTVCFIVLVMSFHCSNVFAQTGMNADSLIRIENKNRDTLIGTVYPAFHATLNGKQYSNKTLKGKTIFINFWFAACVPCMQEMEELNKLYDKFKDKKDFEFISFTFDDAATIQRIKKKFHIRYKIFTISYKECYRLNMNTGFPTSIVLDQSGRFKYISHLAQKDNFIQDVYPLIAID